jgi:hypothetical protein
MDVFLYGKLSDKNTKAAVSVFSSHLRVSKTGVVTPVTRWGGI